MVWYDAGLLKETEMKSLTIIFLLLALLSLSII